MELRHAELDSKEYVSFLSSQAGDKWKRIGVNRRAGVCAPLFSLYSEKSVGIGELPDLKLLIDWAHQTGMSILMLLPMNDVGFDFRPYDSQSTFALEPMHLNLWDLKKADISAFGQDMETLKARFPVGKGRVDYGIKKAKLELLWRIFESSKDSLPGELSDFRTTNRFWLEDYVLFKVLKENFPENTWESWDEPFKRKDEALMLETQRSHESRILFHAWLQWQLFEQFSDVKTYAAKKNVFLIGDLPFLVSRDSSDVWANQGFFKLDKVSGAPPDAYLANGQRWGMPPYRWEAIAETGYAYLSEKLRYAQNFYDMFRIDHFVGLFRLWTIDSQEPPENAGLNGRFDPEEEALWDVHGRATLDAMLKSTNMLPCAEDLGVVPECSYKVLSEYALPGMDVQRWQRAWNTDGSFLDPKTYRKNSAAILSTHDMPIFLAWWNHEVGTADEGIMRKVFKQYGLDFDSSYGRIFEDPAYGRMRWKKEINDINGLSSALGIELSRIGELTANFQASRYEKEKFLEFLGLSSEKAKDPASVAKKALGKAGDSQSIFSIQLIHDWLAVAGLFSEDPWNARINFPGTMSAQNWSVTLPLSLEELNELSINAGIREMNRHSNRI